MAVKVTENEYGKVYIPVGTDYTYVSRSLLEGKVHEKETIDYIVENAKVGVVHAGAGYGDFLPRLDTIDIPIFAFEPNKDNLEACINTIETNNLKNIVLKEQALSDKYGKGVLNRFDNFGRKTGTRCNLVEHSSTECQISTLDIEVDVPIDLIHLDTEGGEINILKGATKLIEKYSPTVIIEVEGAAVLHNEFMESIGYTPVKQLIHNADIMVFVNTVYKRK